ncbi:MAG: cytochrome b [Pseudolabrys sp.]
MIRNTTTLWGWPAKVLHWIGAVAILILLVHGWWMTHMTPRPERLANYAWHSALGYDVLALMMLRLLWRWVNPVPAQPLDSKPWERLAAQFGHIGLYVLIFAVSLTGWVVANTFRVPITQDLVGLTVPRIVVTVERATRAFVEESHMVLAYVLALLVTIHIVGALRHHFWKRNNVLRRMI